MEALMQHRRIVALGSCILALAGAFAPPAFAQNEAPSLHSVRRIYVDKMDNDLDQYIRAEIQKKFRGDIVVVLKPEAADAILAGVSEHQSGTRAAVTGRWMGLHDTATGSVSLLDKSGTTVLWSSEAGDRSLFWGSMKRGGPRKVADRLVSNLKKAME
jgi:hypothetical protein